MKKKLIVCGLYTLCMPCFLLANDENDLPLPSSVTSQTTPLVPLSEDCLPTSLSENFILNQSRRSASPRHDAAELTRVLSGYSFPTKTEEANNSTT